MKEASDRKILLWFLRKYQWRRSDQKFVPFSKNRCLWQEIIFCIEGVPDGGDRSCSSPDNFVPLISCIDWRKNELDNLLRSWVKYEAQKLTTFFLFIQGSLINLCNFSSEIDWINCWCKKLKYWLKPFERHATDWRYRLTDKL